MRSAQVQAEARVRQEAAITAQRACGQLNPNTLLIDRVCMRVRLQVDC